VPQRPSPQTDLADLSGADHMEIEFLLVIDGVSIDDDSVVQTLTEDFDAVLSLNRGVLRLAVSAEGIDPVNALSPLLMRLAAEVPALNVLRLDPDLVGVADIAARVGRSRQNVQQWIDGERHSEAGPFPGPEGSAGRSPVWRWSDVYAWLQPRGLVDDERMPTRTEALLVDLFLMQWLQSRVQGLPMIKTTFAAGDDRSEDRMRAASMSNASLANPQLATALLSLPRANQHQITIVCAVLLDRLDFVVQQLSSELTGVIAVQTHEDQLRFLPISSVQLPWSVPISDLGLGPDATVGDLVLAQDDNLVGPSTPLRLV
jgi:hypothetical protein